MTPTVALSVIIPTIGRPEMLASALRSLETCRPGPDEVLVIDQSSERSIEPAFEGVDLPIEVIHARPAGIGRALNVGLGRARNRFIAVTHDDCRVRADWVGVAHELLGRLPQALLTGQVLAEGGVSGVPSTIAGRRAVEYRDRPRWDVLYPANMAMAGDLAVSLGGFDERFLSAAEDNDFCFRWLASGRPVWFQPAMVVWHADWRPPHELRRLYKRYWASQGELYAKHLRLPHHRSDAMKLMRREFRWCLYGTLRRRLARRAPDRSERAPDPTFGGLTHVPVGLARGLLRRSWR